MKNIIQIILFLGLLSCENSTKTISANKNNGDTTIYISNKKEDNLDSIIYEKLKYPDDTNFFGNLLMAGTFHGDEVCENDAQKKWFGIFKGKNGFYISESKIQTTRVNDPIEDDSLSAKTGWEVTSDNKDTSIIFMANLDILTNSQIKQCSLPVEYVYPGDTLNIKYLGLIYKIYASGGKKKIQADPSWFEVWNYKLYLTTEKNGHQMTELLVAQPDFDDRMIAIIFAGDIDGDGILDLLIDTSRHYNASRPTLYLSKSADKTHLLKIAGQQVYVGC